MLAKDYRLNLRFEPDYKNQFSRLSSAHLVILFQKDSKLPHSRVAVLVSKRLSNKAVDRNAHRRLISDIVQRCWERVPTPYKIIIIPKQKLSLKINELLPELLNLLTRVY